jgi:hypothetical protein
MPHLSYLFIYFFGLYEFSYLTYNQIIIWKNYLDSGSSRLHYFISYMLLLFNSVWKKFLLYLCSNNMINYQFLFLFLFFSILFML